MSQHSLEFSSGCVLYSHLYVSMLRYIVREFSVRTTIESSHGVFLSPEIRATRVFESTIVPLCLNVSHLLVAINTFRYDVDAFEWAYGIATIIVFYPQKASPMFSVNIAIDGCSIAISISFLRCKIEALSVCTLTLYIRCLILIKMQHVVDVVYNFQPQGRSLI